MISAEEMQAFPAIFLRIMGAMILLPFSHSLSNIGKIFAFSFCLSFFFISSFTGTVDFSWSNLIFEFGIGLLISIPSAITIDAIKSLGELFDNQRGVSFAAVYDPNTNLQSSVMSHLSSNFCTVILISAGLLENILVAIKSSILIFPLYSFSASSLSGTAINVISLISHFCSAMFQAFLLCALVFVLVDIASVFLSKVLNQTGLNSEVFLVKTLLGFLILFFLLNADLSYSLMSMAGPNLQIVSVVP